MKDEKSKKGPLILDVDAGTLLVILIVALMAPLLLSGFFSH